MKKVFMMVALVLTCTTGCLANETYAESVTTSEMSSLPAKKSTKKKKAITKKSITTAKKTASKSSTSTATTASTATTDSSKTHSADTVNTKASAVGVLAELLGYAGGNSSNTTGSTTSKVGSIVGSILDNVIGSTTFKKADICAHTWKYKSPGCAFTSENLLAKAGGGKVKHLLSESWIQQFEHILQVQRGRHLQCQDRRKVMERHLHLR